jgi:hypothetical protein
MDAKKKHRQALRRRLEHAEYVILRRSNWPHGTARRMAREKVDWIVKEIKAKESQRESPSILVGEAGNDGEDVHPVVPEAGD